MSCMKSRRSKACDISQRVKDRVLDRDKHRCIFCWSLRAFPNSHYITRANGGLGIEENIVTACLECHDIYDNGDADKRRHMRQRAKDHLMEHYPDWDESKLVYKKYGGEI